MAPYGIVEDPAAEAKAMKWVSRERLLGYLDALGPAGVEPLVNRQRESDDEEAYVAALRLLSGEDPPTGVLCFSDVVASGVYRAAEQLGLDVPGDLSVVGFDDSPLARRLRPQLTTVHQDIAEKGRVAAATLTDRHGAPARRDPAPRRPRRAADRARRPRQHRPPRSAASGAAGRAPATAARSPAARAFEARRSRASSTR